MSSSESSSQDSDQKKKQSSDNKSPSSIEFEENKRAKNIRDSEPFYPMDETVEDIQDQINDLKSRVIEYESRINSVALDPNLLQMIKAPTLSHEIELINGILK